MEDFIVFVENYLPTMLRAAGMTLIISAISVVFGSIIGTLFCILKLSRFWILRIVSNIYIEVFRGTPMLVQLLIFGIALTLPSWPFLGKGADMLLAAIITLSLNSGAYVAEIMRSGIQSVDKGQTEAARSLGMSYSLTMWRIILPQAVRNILPALGNEFIVIIKESSLCYAIGYMELMTSAIYIKAATFDPWTPLLTSAVIYFIMTFILSRVMNKVERRMRPDDQGRRFA